VRGEIKHGHDLRREYDAVEDTFAVRLAGVEAHVIVVV
jgi:hypothetical protein